MKKSYTFNNSTVTIILGNILDSEKEVIVSSDDCYVTMGGGISWSILNAGGKNIMDDAKKQIPAKLGNVVVTTAGALKQKYVFHAITIDKDYARKPYDETQRLEIQQFIVSHSVKQCLRLLSNLNLTSIAFPSIGAGAARIPYELVAASMATAISEMLLATNRHFEVEVYLYDKYHKMEPLDFLPFFERFASAEACGMLSSKISARNCLEGEDNEKLDFSSVDIPAIYVEHSGKHKIFISYFKSKRLYKMECCSGNCTGSCNISCILRNLRLMKHNIEIIQNKSTLSIKNFAEPYILHINFKFSVIKISEF